MKMKPKSLLLTVLLVLLPLSVFAQTPSSDLSDLHTYVLYPTVRVRTDRAIGSGVIIASLPSSNRYDTYLLTNHHVIESAIQINEEWDTVLKKMVKREFRSTIEVEIFTYQNMSKATGTLLVLSDIVAWDKKHDLALIKIRSDAKMQTAKLYPRSKLDDIRIFQPIWLCGAGLGRSPFPTSGIIASLVDEIDNMPYWMVTAPSVFGNSGGGVFLASTKEFIGIPSLLSVTMVGWSPNAVYHMGYIIPISRIYEWLDSVGWSSLYDPSAPSHEEWLKTHAKNRDQNSKD